LVDAKRAAPLLGLLPVELVLKAHYPIPEIWLRRDDLAAAEQAAAALRDAGMVVRVATAADFAAIPPQAIAETFSFGADGLTVALDEADVVLRYDLPLTIVACSPREVADEGGRAAGERTSAAVRTPEGEGSGAWGVFADLYVAPGGRLLRIGVTVAQSDFGSLQGAGLSGPAGKLSRFLTECEARFQRLTIDRRLLHLQTRRRQAPPPGVQRKGFAFATPALTALLEEIDPATADMSQCELSSRLVYLTER
jgi:hypothetical protein